MSFRLTRWMCTILWPIYLLFPPCFPALHQLHNLTQVQQSLVPLQFPLPDVILLCMLCPVSHPFVFRDWVYLYLLVEHGEVFMCKVHIALKEFQLALPMLCGMAFHLSGKVVALHLDNSTADAYLCDHGCTVSLLLSRLPNTY